MPLLEFNVLRQSTASGSCPCLKGARADGCLDSQTALRFCAKHCVSPRKYLRLLICQSKARTYAGACCRLVQHKRWLHHTIPCWYLQLVESVKLDGH